MCNRERTKKISLGYFEDWGIETLRDSDKGAKDKWILKNG